MTEQSQPPPEGMSREYCNCGRVLCGRREKETGFCPICAILNRDIILKEMDWIINKFIFGEHLKYPQIVKQFGDSKTVSIVITESSLYINGLLVVNFDDVTGWMFEMPDEWIKELFKLTTDTITETTIQAEDTYDQNHECDPLIDIPVVAHRCNTCGRLHVYEVIKTVGVPYKLRKIGTIEVPDKHVEWGSKDDKLSEYVGVGEVPE